MKLESIKPGAIFFANKQDPEEGYQPDIITVNTVDTKDRTISYFINDEKREMSANEIVLSTWTEQPVDQRIEPEETGRIITAAEKFARDDAKN